MFTVAWHVVRAAITAKGIYANHRTQCIRDFVQRCGDIVDTKPFEEVFAAWDRWEEETPELRTVIGWCDALARQTRNLRDALGPNESEAAFTGWLPRTV